MNKQLQCNVCGYIADAGEVKGVCPACGVPAKNLLAYSSKLSRKREKTLSLHLHQIAVHFPISLAFLAVLFNAGVLIFGEYGPQSITVGAWITTVLLPAAVLVAMLCGLADGRARFKRLTTPKLKLKVGLGFTLLVISAAAALVMLIVPVSVTMRIITLVLTIIALIPAVKLADVGSGLVCAAMPS